MNWECLLKLRERKERNAGEINQTQIENMSFYDGLNKDFLLIGSHIREAKNYGSQSRSG